MTRSIKTKYSKTLFEARRKLIAEDGFFERLILAITEMINKHIAINEGTIFLIDMGCGEGSHLAAICDMIRSDYEKSVTGAGIDISREGIILDARDYPNKIWAVADLVNTPFKDEQFDVILNILSPSNYAEFNRQLKADGAVVKVVPQSDYLLELRKVFFKRSDKQSYSNKDTVERFSENFNLIDRLRLYYTVDLDKSSVQSLVRMTPLSWATTED